MGRRKRNIETDNYDNAELEGPQGDVKPPLSRSEPVREPRKRERKVAKQVGGVVSGDILASARFRRFYPVALYVSVLVFAYILHIYNFQRLQRMELARRIELNEQRSRAVVFSSMRMNASRHSNIIQEIERRGLGLRESVTPPKYVNED